MITTHVLDTAQGGAAAGVPVLLEFREASGWALVGRGTTDAKGRISAFTDKPTAPGIYRLTFDIQAYASARGLGPSFFPEATVVFRVADASEQFHVPLLLSPFGYTTYRGT